VEDRWYQEQLTRFASRLVRRQHRQQDWREEIRQEAMGVLARQFEAAPDLHVDLRLAERRFAPWMRRIIWRSCQEALRRLRRLYTSAADLLGAEPPDFRARLPERRVELTLAIDRLAEPERSVVALAARGCNLREIAWRLRMDYAATCQAWHRGARRLRSWLRERD
jgi:DNA-directed RNA polymerase specialized sigma24 family protein